MGVEPGARFHLVLVVVEILGGGLIISPNMGEECSCFGSQDLLASNIRLQTRCGETIYAQAVVS